MDKATYGLIGVVLGIALTIVKEWWFQNKKTQKEAEYLSIRITCMLERFMGGCVEVVYDDGLYCGQHDVNGGRRTQVPLPKFEPDSIDVEWKSLPAHLMYDILNFPSDIEAANSQISGAFEYAACPPDYEEGFEERQYQYSLLGIKASELAIKLRAFSKLPDRVVGDWDPIEFMKEKIQKTESIREKRAKQQATMLKNMALKQEV